MFLNVTVLTRNRLLDNVAETQIKSTQFDLKPIWFDKKLYFENQLQSIVN